MLTDEAARNLGVMGSARHWFACFVLGLAVLWGCVGAAAQPRQVFVTADSEPGWYPSPEQEQQVAAALEAYLTAKTEGRFANAYALLTDLQKQSLSYAQFVANAETFNVQAGAPVSHRVLRTTWTKNPAQAPFPGVYAAVDVVARFVNIDRDCGYLVLYQPPGGGAFLVMREESNFIDNASAARITREQSPADLERLWAQLSSNCPNYRPDQPL